MTDAIDLGAGPGGWDVAARWLGLDVLGVELDDTACATRAAAGHRTLQADFSKLEPRDFYGCPGLIGSPPCPTFSGGGKGAGRAQMETILRGIAEHRIPRSLDPISALVIEPLRWAKRMQPVWVALEQVPPALPVWEATAVELRQLGYQVATGVVSAEQFGAPQVRKRAVLLARLDREVTLPEPTHARYDARLGGPARGLLLPDPVVMATAIGWGFTDRPSMTLVSRSAGGGRRLLDGGSGVWEGVLRAVERGAWLRAPHRAGLPFNRGDLSTCPSEDGAVLQTFPRDYPWQGTATKIGQQIGNAVPPTLATRLLEQVVLDRQRPPPARTWRGSLATGVTRLRSVYRVDGTTPPAAPKPLSG